MNMPGRNYAATTSSGYRYGFNGKEKSDEIAIGDLDFGARIYDGRLGRWLSVDPLQKKYPSLSPFIFTNNNPIIYIDFDGRDWTISTTVDKDGNQTITLKLTAAVVNNTANKGINMHTFALKAKDQIINTFSVSYNKAVFDGSVFVPSTLDNYPGKVILKNKSVKVTFKIEVDIRVINDEKEIKANEHLIAIDNTETFKQKGHPNAEGFANKIGGKIIRINEQMATGIIANTDRMGLPHEVGHTLGLEHSDIKYSDAWDKLWGIVDDDYLTNEKLRNENLMRHDYPDSKTMPTGATGLTDKQMEKVIKNVKNEKVNKN
jgi:RHS repeat-associated protein